MKLAKWPSTTEILRHFGLMADLEGFSNGAAMRRGILVTAACHLIGMNQDLGDGWEGRHPECHGYLDAYRKFKRDHELKVVEVEHEYRNEIYRYVSHPDQIVLLDNYKGEVDLELKSGSMPRWCQLQTAGQVLAIGNPRMKRFALLLREDGTFKLYPHDDWRDLDRFISLIDAYWIWQEFRPRLDEGAIP